MKIVQYKSFGLLALVLLLGSLLSACGFQTRTPAPTPKPSPTASPTPVGQSLPVATPTPLPPTPSQTLQGEIIIWEQLDPEQAVFLRNKLETFQKLYPDVLFNLRHIEPESFNSALSQAGKAGPHLFLGPATQAGEWQRAGVSLPVDSFFDKKFLDTFELTPLQGLTLDGKLWGLPFDYGQTLMLFYNKKLVGPDKVPNTWDALTAYVRANPSRKDEFYPFAADLNDPNLLLAALGAAGGSPLDSNNRPNLNTEAMQNALQFLQDNLFRYKTLAPIPSYNQMQALFKAGKVAFIIGGTENLAEYRQAGVELGLVRLPKLNDHPLTPPANNALAWFMGSAVKEDGPKLAAVRLFLNYMSEPEQQRELFTQLKLLPPTRTGLSDPLIKNDAIWGAVAEQAKSASAVSPLPEWRAIFEAMRTPIANVVALRASPAEGAAAMQDLALKSLKK